MSKELRDREAFYKSLKREARHGVEREGIASLRPQLRETDAGPIVSGYATVYEVEYEVWDWLGAYTEKVSRGAATKTLAERPDVRYLLNHEGVPLARTASGTLTLSQDDTGLLYETTPLDLANPRAAEVVSALRRRDAAESSFAFRVTRDMWDEGYESRTIMEFNLHDGDVSTVTYPANPYTTSGLRSLEDFANTDIDELVKAVRGGDRGLVLRAASNVTRLVPMLQQRAEPDGEDEPAEEAEEISDLMVLQGQLDAAGMLVAQMLAEEAEDAPAGTQTNGRDKSTTLSLTQAQRDLELLQLGPR